MLVQDNITDWAEEPYFFKGNEPLLLDNPQTIWLVQSGSLALFAIGVQHGIPTGRRRYLFSVKAGELMFGATLNLEDEQYQILAIALEETELLQSQTQFSQWFTEEPEDTLKRIESWIHQLGSTLAGISSPTLPTPLETAGCGILSSGEVFQPPQGTVVWVQILQGQVNLLGFNGLELMPDLGRIPLEMHLWLQASDIVELDYIYGKEITDIDS